MRAVLYESHHKKGNLKYRKSALSGCAKRETFGPRRYIAPSSIIHIVFSWAFGFIVPYFSLVLFKDIVRKQFPKMYTLKRFILGCTDCTLTGCTKAESLRTRWDVLSKTKTGRIITEIFQFYATYFILHFLLRTFFKRVGEPLFLLTVHPKLNFRGALKKALMVPEDRSYQTQYLAKSFPSSLASTL